MSRPQRIVRLDRIDPTISANQPGVHRRARGHGVVGPRRCVDANDAVGGYLTSTKIDPRLLISIGFLVTALTLHRFTIINLQIDFHTIVMLRAAQVLFLPLIFIPISTLNYVGVPREKNNQVSGLSNFARNLGGSIGTSLLTTFLARQNQIHQVNFAAHTGRGDASISKPRARRQVAVWSPHTPELFHRRECRLPDHQGSQKFTKAKALR